MLRHLRLQQTGCPYQVCNSVAVTTAEKNVFKFSASLSVRIFSKSSLFRSGLGMRGIKKCSTIIYRLKKHCDTGIYCGISWRHHRRQFLQRFNRTNHLQCSHRFSLQYIILLILAMLICKLSASGRGCHVAGVMLEILANVHVRYAVARPSVVCNVRAPYSTGWNFQQCFYAIW